MSTKKSCFNCIHGFQDEVLKETRELLCTLGPQITQSYTEEEMAMGTALQDLPDLCKVHNLEGIALNKAFAKKKRDRKSQDIEVSET
jgi:hypothetical protein